jgi:hypothetical protein
MGAARELLHLFANPECPEHGSRTYYDHRFRSLRCVFCGHRVRKDGESVPSTRSMPFWMWPKEVGGRAQAKQTQGKHRAPRLSSQ